MPSPIAVDILVDVDRAIKNFLRGGQAAEKFGATLKEVDLSTSRTRVAASAKRIQALRTEAAEFKQLSLSFVRGSDEQVAASKLAVDANRRLAAALGLTARESRQMGLSAAVAERNLGRASRGALAGSGVFRGLGRSLAFASGGFLAFSGISSTLRDSIEGAEQLEKAQRGLDVAIEHTGGNLAKLKPRYEAVAQAAAQFGINQADATTALNRATVLTGNAVKAQRAYQEALVISKATGKDFNTVLTATAKGQEGVTTSLQRYGILIAKGTPSQKQFNTVMSRFAGQARANTSAIDRFNATWQNTEEIIGTALLPTLNQYLSKFSDWLTKMQRTGRLQRDVNTAVHDASAFLHVLEGAVKAVDKVTGSFAHTLEILATVKLASWTADGILGLRSLASAFRRTGGAAVVAEGEVAGLRAGLLSLGSAPVLTALAAVAGLLEGIKLSGGSRFVPIHTRGGTVDVTENGLRGGLITRSGRRVGVGSSGPPPPDNANVSGGGSRGAGFGHHRRPHLPASARTPGTTETTNRSEPKPIRELKIPQGLITAQLKAQAGMGNIVKADEAIRNYILRLLHSGRLHGKAVQEAYQELASVNAEIAAQVHKATASAKKAAAKSRDFTEPLKLQLADARAQALGLDEKPILEKMRAAAFKAIRSGKLSIQGQINAYNEIASLNQQLGDSVKSALGGFKELNTRKIAQSLKSLSPADRKKLRAELSQIGPGMTVPGQGVGAYGYVIGSDDRPIHLHTHVEVNRREIGRASIEYDRRRRRRNPAQRRGANAGGG